MVWGGVVSCRVVLVRVPVGTFKTYPLGRGVVLLSFRAFFVVVTPTCQVVVGRCRLVIVVVLSSCRLVVSLLLSS